MQLTICTTLFCDAMLKFSIVLYLPYGGAPVITQNTPREVSVLQGQDVWIQCEASGSQPLHFQWFKKREELCGKTEKTLILQNVCQEDQGHYVCRVANRFGFCVFTDWTRVSVSGEQAEALQCFGKIGTVKHLHY